MSEIFGQELTEDQLRAWTDQHNRKAAELAVPEVKSEILQLDDLASAYSEMDRRIADPTHPFGEQTFLDMHFILSANIPHVADFRGRYYLGPRRIRSAVPRDQILPFVEGQEKIRAMRRFGEDYAEYMEPTDTPKPIDAVKNAADVITQLSDVHPFVDGNSRVGRLGADSVFLRQGMHQIPLWSNDFRMGGIDPKAAFYRLVEMSRRGNPDPLHIVLAEEQINASLAEINAYLMDPRIGEMPEAKSAIDYQRELIRELSEFVESAL